MKIIDVSLSGPDFLEQVLDKGLTNQTLYRRIILMPAVI